MTQLGLYDQGYRVALEEKLAGLNLVGELEIRTTADSLEAAQGKMAREVDAELLSAQTKVALAIRVALAKLDRGEFGRCDECGDPISPRRLGAVPWAAFCLACQEGKDREEEGRVRLVPFGRQWEAGSAPWRGNLEKAGTGRF